MSITIPAPSAQAANRHARYIASTTQSMAIRVNGGTATNIDVTSRSPGCVPGPPVSCSVTVSAPLGRTTFDVQLYNAPGGAGGTGLVLARNQVIYTVVTGPNTLPIVLNGVVNAVTLTLASASLPAGATGSTTLNVKALDPDGNVIVTPGSYVDVNGNPLTITLTSTQSTPTVRAPYSAGAATLATTTLSGPGSVNVNYDGNALLSTQFTATVSGGAVIAPATATLTLTPTAYLYALPAGSNPYQMAVGPDNQIWVALFDGAVGHFVPVGPGGTLSFTRVPTPNGAIGITAGSDGNMWYTDWNFEVYRLPTTATQASDSTLFTVPSNKPWGIVDGGDGKMYLTYSYYTGPASFPVASTPGAITPVDLGIGGGGYLIVGPDQRVWTVAGQGGCCFTPSIVGIPTGVSANTALTQWTFGPDMSAVASGSDGNIWYSERAAGQIGRIAPNAAAASARVDPPLGGGRQPSAITGGPDGAIYFADLSTNSIGRVPVTATSGALGLTTYTIPGPPTGINYVMTGPDGNIWFNTTGATASVGKLAL